ncbi:carbohydrate ABC transporter permease [Parasphaerochaeta coccoides]|uniref:Carbohydrate ABC transporter membrane protein 2, CUT1 family n=1 Tax=Parasphaerochaeta coccoides (strain ATCC BAA-1237 / DSM 17374 / SPN1) TaxID=760011 RepID=F4GIW8_PARC1|nr:carbohydrate ABC transporter permease [Parasphaerochaeta coccoides]AEC02736.1 carbohydrate ABC transporter membrane protein 2, CUT1 family [Parasphaerochaeta coccoides DSM 17374]
MPGTRSRTIKRSPFDQVQQVFIYIIVAAFALMTLLPFIYVIAGSFATERELTERSFFLIPRQFSLNAYEYILNAGDVLRGLKNSFIVALVGTCINMFLSTTLAYPLSRTYFKGRNFLMMMVLICLLFPAGMVPMYMLVANGLKLKNSFWALWLPGGINMFNMIIIKNYFQGIPQELEEAARIDGANDLNIFVRIFLPLSKPALASVSLFYAVSHWNAYFNAMMYISDMSKEVVQIALRRIIFLTSMVTMDSGFDWGAFGLPPEKAVKMATTVVATIPMLMLYPFIQKYFTQGVMIGSVKG